jgi:hypothetical protein
MENFILSGFLNIGKHKAIACDVQIQIESLKDDIWSTNIDKTESRAIGTLSFETSPIENPYDFPVKNNVVGELTLREPVLEDQTKLNILIVDKKSEIWTVPKKIKRYFWNFFVIGKPVWDNLKIFPDNYMKENMNRVFYCTNFRNKWESEVAAVIVAQSLQEAKILLIERLKEFKIHPEDEKFYDLKEIDINSKSAIILISGDMF